MRRLLYRLASLLGDLSAITHPRRIPKRAYNRTLWKMGSRIMRKGMWK